MADMRITGTRGGSSLPPEDRRTNLTEVCQNSIAHTKGVAERMVFTHFDGVSLNVTPKAPGADKVHGLLFRQ